jgi:hypothetical protein
MQLPCSRGLKIRSRRKLLIEAPITWCIGEVVMVDLSHWSQDRRVDQSDELVLQAEPEFRFRKIAEIRGPPEDTGNNTTPGGVT